jgi:predicted aminopeptidase
MRALLPLLLLCFGCRAGYVVRSGAYQLELMRSRVPVAEVEADPALLPTEREALATIAAAMAFGQQIGLSSTDSYGTVAWEWEREIWNFTACEPLSFTPQQWWFPIVGRVPYLGFFSREAADHEAARWRDRGLDVYVREAGAYSTLGWFRDPILRPMLSWGELDLSDTILHELAHATVWIPGSVDFNESFANFVGEEAALRFLAQRHGPDSEQVRAARNELADLVAWRDLQHDLYGDLATIYQDDDRSEPSRISARDAAYASFKADVVAAPFADPARFRDAALTGTWNNARLIGFMTYNDSRPLFEAVLASEDGDLRRFMDRIDAITAEGPRRDPFAALAMAVTTAGREEGSPTAP